MSHCMNVKSHRGWKKIMFTWDDSCGFIKWRCDCLPSCTRDVVKWQPHGNHQHSELERQGFCCTRSCWVAVICAVDIIHTGISLYSLRKCASTHLERVSCMSKQHCRVPGDNVLTLSHFVENVKLGFYIHNVLWHCQQFSEYSQLINVLSILSYNHCI